MSEHNEVRLLDADVAAPHDPSGRMRHRPVALESSLADVAYGQGPQHISMPVGHYNNVPRAVQSLPGDRNCRSSLDRGHMCATSTLSSPTAPVVMK
jgi:hypothetical protein